MCPEGCSNSHGETLLLLLVVLAESVAQLLFFLLIVFLNNLFFAKPYVHWGNEQSLSIHMGFKKSNASVLSYWPSLPSASVRCLGYAHLE